METSQQLIEVLQKTFHFEKFRPGQLEAITTLMSKGRLLCIHPTGYGKSLLYQLPSVLLDGITLLISPLLALMRDQLTHLNVRFNISAASINTDQSDEENFAAKKAAQDGSIRILFIAPEQLDHVDRFDFILKLPISLLVVDEAHCISTWGHDFRPSYRQIIKLTHALTAKNPKIKLLALTATANNKTEADIKQQLSVDNQEVIVHRESMDRPNIRLSVVPAAGIALKLATLTDVLSTLKGAGLIYCATRENSELVADYLSAFGRPTMAYHAGLETAEKRRIQNDFLHDNHAVIAATNALGMGIDKPNLRFVIHFDFPGSITAYYQEVGRCGRDGLPADGVLLYDPKDSKIQEHFINSAQPTPADFQAILNTIASSNTPLGLTALKSIVGLHPTRLTVVIAELIEQEFLKKISQYGLQVYRLTNKPGIPDLSRYNTQLMIRNAELAAMQHYAEQSETCLMAILRQALGDNKIENCKQCSMCRGSNKIFNLKYNDGFSLKVLAWLNERSNPIALNKRIKNMAPGIAVLDGKFRSKDFLYFMRARANSNNVGLGISDELLEWMRQRLQNLKKQHPLTCIISVPSRTWTAREAVSEYLANFLNIYHFPHLLYWEKLPAARQGELLNNDQRKANVANHMRLKFDKNIPKGSILLLDDYIGSGATLNEAASTLRKYGQINNEIVPFTIAAVKWHLGKRGMV